MSSLAPLLPLHGPVSPVAQGTRRPNKENKKTEGPKMKQAGRKKRRGWMLRVSRVQGGKERTLVVQALLVFLGLLVDRK